MFDSLAFGLRDGQVGGPYGGPGGINPFDLSPFPGSRCEFLYFGGSTGTTEGGDGILKSLNFYFDCEI